MPDLKSIENKPIQVSSLKTLRQEKVRLKQLCNEVEREGFERRDHLKRHWVSMALNSILPNKHPEKRIFDMAAEGAKSAWESTNFRSVLVNGLITVVEFVAVRQGVKLFEKLFTKKKSQKEKKDNSEDE